MTTQTEDQRVDGRTARRDRNRVAVLDAVIELFSESNLSPGVHEVAARSGVSLRSVYRYFEDVDDLIAAAMERQIDKARPLFQMPELGEGPLPARIDRFAARRVALFEAVRDIYRASVVRLADDSQVSSGLEQVRGWMGHQTKKMFLPELDAMEPDTASVVELSLDTLTQFDSLEHLRSGRELSPDELVEYLRGAVSRLLR